MPGQPWVSVQQILKLNVHAAGVANRQRTHNSWMSMKATGGVGCTDPAMAHLHPTPYSTSQRRKPFTGLPHPTPSGLSLLAALSSQGAASCEPVAQCQRCLTSSIGCLWQCHHAREGLCLSSLGSEPLHQLCPVTGDPLVTIMVVQGHGCDQVCQGAKLCAWGTEERSVNRP